MSTERVDENQRLIIEKQPLSETLTPKNPRKRHHLNKQERARLAVLPEELTPEQIEELAAEFGVKAATIIKNRNKLNPRFKRKKINWKKSKSLDEFVRSLPASLSLKQWEEAARRVDVSVGSLRSRHFRVNKKRKNKPEGISLAQLAEQKGISYTTLWRRWKKGQVQKLKTVSFGNQVMILSNPDRAVISDPPSRSELFESDPFIKKGLKLEGCINCDFPLTPKQMTHCSLVCKGEYLTILSQSVPGVQPQINLGTIPTFLRPKFLKWLTTEFAPQTTEALHLSSTAFLNVREKRVWQELKKHIGEIVLDEDLAKVILGSEYGYHHAGEIVHQAIEYLRSELRNPNEIYRLSKLHAVFVLWPNYDIPQLVLHRLLWQKLGYPIRRSFAQRYLSPYIAGTQYSNFSDLLDQTRVNIALGGFSIEDVRLNSQGHRISPFLRLFRAAQN